MNLNRLFYSIYFLLTACNEKHYIFDVPHDFQLNENSAITISKEALVEFGVNVENMQPVPYRPKDNLIFVTNINNPNIGFVLWHELGKETNYEYSIKLSYDNNQVSCEVDIPK